jgi:hypothetical protein
MQLTGLNIYIIIIIKFDPIVLLFLILFKKNKTMNQQKLYALYEFFMFFF